MRTIDVMYILLRRSDRIADVYRMAHGRYPGQMEILEFIYLLIKLRNKE